MSLIFHKSAKKKETQHLTLKEMRIIVKNYWRQTECSTNCTYKKLLALFIKKRE
jgi:hypothetical protein